MTEREHDGPDHQEGGGGQSCSAVGALCLYINEEGSQLGQTMALHTQAHLMLPGLSCVPLEGSQIKSDVVVLSLQKT